MVGLKPTSLTTHSVRLELRMAVQLIDESEQILHSKLTAKLLASTQREIGTEFGRIHRRLYVAGTVLEPREASAAIAELIVSIEKSVQKLADGYSPARWLWMLRRSPDHAFAGDLKTSLPYARMLAEIAAARSPIEQADSLRLSKGRVTYPLVGAVFRRVGRLAGAVNWLRALHAAYRWSNKGASIRFDRVGFPQAIRDDEPLNQAVALYDTRALANREPFLRGAAVLGASTTGSVSEGGSIPVFEELSRTVAIPITARVIGIDTSSDVEPDQVVELASRFSVRAARLRTEYWSLPASTWTQEDAKSAGAIVSVLLGALGYFTGRPASLVSILKYGYSWVTEPQLIELIEVGLRAAIDNNLDISFGHSRLNSPDEALVLIRTLPLVAWPPSAPSIVANEGEHRLLDLRAASRHLDLLLTVPTRGGGSAAHEFGLAFETVVQGMIDESRWRPTRALLELRGRQLQIGGERIGDIDAIAELEGRVVVISCKAYRNSNEYERGDHRTIRNIQTRLLSDVDSAMRFESRVNATRRGDNFDLSHVTSCHVAVCTAFAAFVPVGAATEIDVLGLRRACSLGELALWLESDSEFPSSEMGGQ